MLKTGMNVSRSFRVALRRFFPPQNNAVLQQSRFHKRRSDKRALAWTNAKEAGHAHEHHVAKLLRNDLIFSEKLAFQCFGRHMGAPVSVRADGKHAKKVQGILGKKTTSKVDIYVEWSDS